MIDLLTILSLLVPIPVAAALYGLCVHVLQAHDRGRVPGEVVVDRREPAASSARGREGRPVVDSRQVA